MGGRAGRALCLMKRTHPPSPPPWPVGRGLCRAATPAHGREGGLILPALSPCPCQRAAAARQRGWVLVGAELLCKGWSWGEEAEALARTAPHAADSSHHAAHSHHSHQLQVADGDRPRPWQSPCSVPGRVRGLPGQGAGLGGCAPGPPKHSESPLHRLLQAHLAASRDDG